MHLSADIFNTQNYWIKFCMAAYVKSCWEHNIKMSSPTIAIIRRQFTEKKPLSQKNIVRMYNFSLKQCDMMTDEASHCLVTISYTRIRDNGYVRNNRTDCWERCFLCGVRVNQRFGGTCRLHLQGPRISQARNQHETLYPRRQNSS
jgi:hypothetical protein